MPANIVTDPPVAALPTDNAREPEVPVVATPVASETLPVVAPVAEEPLERETAPVVPDEDDAPVATVTAPPMSEVLEPALIETDPAALEVLSPAERVSEPPVAADVPTATVMAPAW